MRHQRIAEFFKIPFLRLHVLLHQGRYMSPMAYIRAQTHTQAHTLAHTQRKQFAYDIQVLLAINLHRWVLKEPT